MTHRSTEGIRRWDDPVSVEVPADFDEAAERARAEALVDDLAANLGEVTAEVGPPNIQDATFFATLPVSVERDSHEVQIWVRLSNFGRLATAGVDNPGLHDDEELHRLVDRGDWQTALRLLDEHGYSFIRKQSLWRDYDGQNRWLKEFYQDSRARLTWWIRYFDWV